MTDNSHDLTLDDQAPAAREEASFWPFLSVVIAGMGAGCGLVVLLITVGQTIWPSRRVIGPQVDMPSVGGLIIFGIFALVWILNVFGTIAMLCVYGFWPKPTDANKRAARWTIILTAIMLGTIGLSIGEIVRRHYANISSNNVVSLTTAHTKIGQLRAIAVADGRFPNRIHEVVGYATYFGREVPYTGVDPQQLDSIIILVEVTTTSEPGRVVAYASGRTALVQPRDFAELVDADETARQAIRAPLARTDLRMIGISRSGH